MSYKVIKGNNCENFSKIYQHWAGDPLQGVFGIYERYRYRTTMNSRKLQFEMPQQDNNEQ